MLVEVCLNKCHKVKTFMGQIVTRIKYAGYTVTRTGQTGPRGGLNVTAPGTHTFIAATVFQGGKLQF